MRLPVDVDLPLSVRTSACANGETVELRLMTGETQIGPSVFVNGRETSLIEAMRRLLSVLGGDER